MNEQTKTMMADTLQRFKDIHDLMQSVTVEQQRAQALGDAEELARLQSLWVEYRDYSRAIACEYVRLLLGIDVVK
jgi:hypothetical protein